MTIRKYITNSLSAILILSLLNSCKKDSAGEVPDVFYSVELDGYTVKFTNETQGATSYRWDFGDGGTSTEASPSHEYPGKGKYVPTLYATSASGAVAEGSTVINISKASPISLTDNSLADWDTITHNMIIAGTGGGVMKKAKYDYNSDYVFCYYEMTAKVSDGHVFDFYLDSDNIPTTGYLTWIFSASGNDVVLEGSMFPGGWFDPLYFTGGSNQNAWSWDVPSIPEFYDIGTVVQDGSTLKFEMGLKRAKLKGLIGKAIKIGLAINKNDWSTMLGSIPDVTTPSFLLDMSE